MTETVVTETVEWLGEEFHVAERVSSLTVMRFAKIAKSNIDVAQMEGLAAMYDLLEQCVHPDDWDRFEAHADAQRADGEELLGVVKKVFAVIASRPTRRSSDSSGGPRTIEPSSTADSFSPDTGPARAITRLNAQGRPDLALVVRRRQESLSA